MFIQSRISVALLLASLSVIATGQTNSLTVSDLESPRAFGSNKRAQAPVSVKPNLGDAASVMQDGLLTDAMATTLSRVLPERSSTLRGAKEAQLYRKLSPAVVLVLTNDGLGSGSLINKQGDVLTNWHVVKGYRQVGVIFKPSVEGQALTKADLRRGTVVKVDEVSDLALVRVADIPLTVTPIALGSMSDAIVGEDVHAIGHPTGETWTYTKGVISQVRRNFEWTEEETKKAHHADVVQTQTPINPGNSGGPLLSDSGTLIGVNSFKSQGEGLNFAVAVDEVARFVAAPVGRTAVDAQAPAIATSVCEPKTLFEGRNDAGDGQVIVMDLDCDGDPDVELRIPDDKSLPNTAVFDRNRDGKVDLVVFDFYRNGVWELSLHDVKFTGKWDLIGLHPDGKIVASRFIPYTKEAFATEVAKYRH
jgi:S1-C subfamily serine protease